MWWDRVILSEFLVKNRSYRRRDEAMKSQFRFWASGVLWSNLTQMHHHTTQLAACARITRPKSMWPTMQYATHSTCICINEHGLPLKRCSWHEVVDIFICVHILRNIRMLAACFLSFCLDSCCPSKTLEHHSILWHEWNRLCKSVCSHNSIIAIKFLEEIKTENPIF